MQATHDDPSTRSPQRTGRRARALLPRAADRLLPQRLLRDRAEDLGLHTVCAVMTAEFLAFSASAGNDLTTPKPDNGFPRLEARRPLVPLRAALEGGARRRRRPAGGAGSDPRGDPGDHPAGGPEGLRGRRVMRPSAQRVRALQPVRRALAAEVARVQAEAGHGERRRFQQAVALDPGGDAAPARRGAGRPASRAVSRRGGRPAGRPAARPSRSARRALQRLVLRDAGPDRVRLAAVLERADALQGERQRPLDDDGAARRRGRRPWLSAISPKKRSVTWNASVGRHLAPGSPCWRRISPSPISAGTAIAAKRRIIAAPWLHGRRRVAPSDLATSGARRPAITFTPAALGWTPSRWRRPGPTPASRSG